jgi:hypothetical protein
VTAAVIEPKAEMADAWRVFDGLRRVADVVRNSSMVMLLAKSSPVVPKPKAAASWP